MRLFITLLIFLSAFSACKDKVICPAFQSTYILDDSVRMAYYSYLWKIDETERTKYLASKRTTTNDTSATASIVPNSKVDYFAHAGQYVVNERPVKKSKYGIIKYEPYWLKTQRMKTAPMENVLKPDKIVPPIQSDTTPVDTGDIYLSDFSDSLAVDSAALAIQLDTANEVFVLPTLARAAPPEKKAETKYLYRYDPKDKALNVEQDYYNKHYGKYLIAQPKRPKPVPVEEETAMDSTAVEGGQSDQLLPNVSDTTSGAGFVKPKKKKRSKKLKATGKKLPPEEEPPVDNQPAEEQKEEPAEPEDDGF